MFRYCVFIGEGGEEGAGEGEVEGEAADSPGAGEDAASSVNSGAMSPSSEAGVGGAPLSRSATPTSPHPSSAATGIMLQQHEGSELLLQQHELDQDIPVAMLHDQLALRDTPVQRCPSRDSRGSSVPRCPSRDSQCSERGIPRVALPPVSPVTASSAVLPPTLLPPHSAALAAYLGAAAAQHQHHRLLMTSPLPAVLPRGSVSPLVTSSSSPPLLPLVPPGSLAMSPPPPPLRSPAELDSSTVLDFSTKRGICKPEQDNDSALNLSKPPTPVLPAESQLNSPLDLSVSSNRKRSLDASSPIPQTPSPQHHPPSSRKNSRMAAPSEYKPVVSPWTSPVVASHFPYFAAAVAAASSLSPKNNSSHNTSNHGHSVDNPLWNGKMKMSHDGKMGNSGTHFGGMPTPSDATKALEKMSELSKLGGEDLFRSSSNNVGGGGGGGGSSNRHSAWQSHWLNKGAEQAKDVLKCVWCKQSFPSLAAMTAHMKEAKHCGVNVPPPQIQPPPPPPPPQQQHQPPTSSPSLSVNSGGGGHQSGGNKPSSADLNLLIKETMPLPRKLVRGQDVWLGKGAEQTRQILKCMWCGQSFRSLAEMTSHMQQTQHYTNIISQEQIISWKSADDGGKPGGGNTPGGGGGGSGGGAASSHVSAVLTCKVCDQAFSSLKELSNHMVKNSHYKEHIMRSITESGGRRRQTREKRKKSLPVRKLLELERAQHELKNGEGGMMVGGGGKIGREPPTTGRITCEKCGEKIETSIFVDHIRQCVGGGSIGTNQRNLLKSALLSSNIIPPDNPLPIAERDCRKSSCEEPVPPTTPRHHRSPSIATDLSNKEGNGTAAAGDTSSPSVLNAIEKLIEKSFDSRARHGAAGFGGGPGGVGASPIGSSILKRLGIDESVDYTKPLVDPQTMNLLRSYHHHQQQNQHHQYRRERSGSESSSISERGIGRGDALTPDRKAEICSEQRLPTSSFSPRTTPEKRIQTPPSHNDHIGEDAIKKEVITDDEREVLCKETRREVIVKKEEVEEAEEDEDDKGSFHSGGGGGRHRRGEDVPLAPSNSGVHESLEEEGEDRQNGHTDSGRRSHGSVGMHSPGTMSPRQQVPLVEAVNVPPSSPCRNSVGSPASSDRSGTPRSTTSAEKKPSSLGALSSMFDNLSGVGGGTTSGAGESATSSGGRSTSSHPLAALQKLCDKTERHGGGSRSASSSSASGSGGHASSSTSSQAGAGGTTPGAILAFSWACNDAVMTADSIMKCAFCDTPFISKGAYRHHLSKMHFVKDGAIPDPVALKAQAQQGSSTSVSASGSKAHNTSGIAGGANSVSGNSSAPSSSGKSPQQQLNFEESPHSKFLKYTELAKQLSSKYV
uniref:C2H2-type domain-containing protein n=1 Tax=Timema tahoe TaxID=61484 RepID=A0A7R9I9V2_9NEOP|nr:unnamed protein product [Timema tahoe]